MKISVCGVALVGMCVLTASAVRAEKAADPPEGFVAIFDGRDLTGWRGMGHTNPYE